MRHFLAGTLALALIWASGGAAAAPPDVRVLIDVSGSMYASDPAVLRGQALTLLLKLLPPGSRAGVWRFSGQVHEVVPYGEVTAFFKAQADASIGSLAAEGSYTNIDAALAAASAPAPAGTAHIILLTDGQLDIDPDPQRNQAARTRLLAEHLPQWAAKGFKIHTVALGPGADRELLIALSLATGGHAAEAATAPALTEAFLAALDSANPAQTAPLEDGYFAIDSSVEEFTVVILSPAPGAARALIDPSGNRYVPGATTAGVQWQTTPQYELLTAQRPPEGRWRLEGAAGARVRLLTDLRLMVRGLEPNANVAEPLPVAAALLDRGQRVTDAALLGLMQVSLERRGPDGQLWQQALQADAEGLFQTALAPLPAGQYQFTLRVTGPTFVREQSRQVVVRPPFEAELQDRQGADGQWLPTLLVRAVSLRIQPAGTQVAVTVIDPDGRRRVRPLTINADGHWQLPLTFSRAGDYLLAPTVSGTAADGAEFYYELAPLAYQYDPALALGAVPIAPPPAPPVAETPPPALPLEPPPAPVPEPVSSSTNWLLWLGLATGASVLAGAGFWFWRRRRQQPFEPAAAVAAATTAAPATAEPPRAAVAAAVAPMAMPEPELFETAAELDLPPLQPLDNEVSPEEAAADAAELDDAISSLIDELDGNR